MRRLYVDLAKLALSAALIWLSFSRIDSAAAFALLATVRPEAVTAAIALLVAQHALGGLRFHYLLAQLKTPISKLAAVDNVFIGFFFSQIFISFIGGDAVRVWRLADAGISPSAAFKSVLFDRVLGFVSLIALILIGLPALFAIVTDQTMRTNVVATVLIGVIATLAFLLMHRLPRFLQRWRVFGAASEISTLALSISRRPAAIAYLLGVSLLIQLANVFGMVVIAWGLGITSDFLNFLVLVPPVMLLAILPISFAGWGVREASMALALGLVGIHAEQSVAISICFGLCLLVSGLPGAIGWLKSRRNIAA